MIRRSGKASLEVDLFSAEQSSIRRPQIVLIQIQCIAVGCANESLEEGG